MHADAGEPPTHGRLSRLYPNRPIASLSPNPLLGTGNVRLPIPYSYAANPSDAHCLLRARVDCHAQKCEL